MLVHKTARMELLGALQRLDSRLFITLFRQGERRMIRPVARAVSRSADGHLHLLIPPLLMFLGVARLGEFVALLLCALAVERVLYWVLKNGLRRRRPQDYWPGFQSIVIAGDKFSFPSGHTSAAFLLATVLSIIYQGPVYSIYVWAASVALSRVILGVHYPGDTLAGAIMGSGIALFMARQLGYA